MGRNLVIFCMCGSSFFINSRKQDCQCFPLLILQVRKAATLKPQKWLELIVRKNFAKNKTRKCLTIPSFKKKNCRINYSHDQCDKYCIIIFQVKQIKQYRLIQTIYALKKDFLDLLSFLSSFSYYCVREKGMDAVYMSNEYADPHQKVILFLTNMIFTNVGSCLITEKSCDSI